MYESYNRFRYDHAADLETLKRQILYWINHKADLDTPSYSKKEQSAIKSKREKVLIINIKEQEGKEHLRIRNSA